MQKVRVRVRVKVKVRIRVRVRVRVRVRLVLGEKDAEGIFLDIHVTNPPTPPPAREAVFPIRLGILQSGLGLVSGLGSSSPSDSS